MKLNHTQLKRVAERAFALGVILFAILLPLEIVPNRLISLLSIATTVLLIPHATIQVLNRGTRTAILRSRLWILVLPVLVAAASYLTSHAIGSQAPVRTLAILTLRTWLIAQFATHQHLRLLENTTLIVGAAVVVFGFFQLLGDLFGLSGAVTRLRDTYSSHGSYAFPRIHSLAREPLLLANYLFIPMAIAAVRLVTGTRYSRQLITFLLASGLLFATLNSRGGNLSLLVSVVILIFAVRKSIRPSTLMKTAGAMIATLAIAAALITGFAGRSALAAFLGHTTEVKDASFQNRVNVWQKSSDILKNHPLLGVGLNNSTKYLWGGGNPCTPLPADPPVFNNTYLTVATELGVGGILALLPLIAFLLSFAVHAIRSQLTTPGAAFALIIPAYSIQMATYEGFLNLRLWGVVAFALLAWRINTIDMKSALKPKKAAA